MDHLTNRPKYVWLRDCGSVVVSSTGVLQGSGLSPFLSTLHTQTSGTTQKAVTSRSSQITQPSLEVTQSDELYREIIANFVNLQNHLYINTTKMKELAVDFYLNVH